jgi:hypothetical protein
MCLSVVLGGVIVAYMPLDPRIAGSNQAKDDGFLRAIKIRIRPSFGGEVRPSAPCSNISQRVKNPFEVLTNSSFPSKVPPALLLDDSVGSIAR